MVAGVAVLRVDFRVEVVNHLHELQRVVHGGTAVSRWSWLSRDSHCGRRGSTWCSHLQFLSHTRLKERSERVARVDLPFCR